MSDQTPEAALDASEPSMEDILASIRKIIADDDAPAQQAPEAMGLADLSGGSAENFGNINDLVAPSPARFENDSNTIDPGIEHFVADDVLDVSEPNVAAEVISEGGMPDEVFDEGLGSVDLVDSLMMDLSPQPELPDASLPETSDVNLIMTDPAVAGDEAVQASLVDDSAVSYDIDDIALETPAANVVDIAGQDLSTDFDGMMDFDLDAELADLEIPTPDPSEVTSNALNVEALNVEDEIITRPGAAVTAMTAAGVGVLGAIGLKTVELQDASLDDTALDDIDMDLSALLDTDLTLDDDMTASLTDVTSAISEQDGSNITVDITRDIDLTDANALDADLTRLLDDVAPTEVVSIDTIAAGDVAVAIKTPVSDDELESLLEDMDFDEAPALNENALDNSLLDGEAANIAQEAAQSEEDVDLLLVKSLMADLADYNSNDDDLNENDVQYPNIEDAQSKTSLDGEATPLTENTVAENDELDALLGTLVDPEPADVSEHARLGEQQEASDAELLSDIPDEIEAEDSAMLDEILDMTLEDELQSGAELGALEGISSADDVAALELDNIAENAELDAEDVQISSDDALDIDTMLVDITAPAEIEFEANPNGGEATEKSMSLSGIAAAAQADADAADNLVTSEGIGLGAVLSGAGVASLGAAIMDNQDGGDTAEHDLDLTQFDETDVDISSGAKDDDVEQLLYKLLDDDTADTLPEDEVFDLEVFANGEDDFEDDIGLNNEIEVDIIEDAEIYEPEPLGQATATSEQLTILETTQETTDMPRAAAKNSDIIMDDVTEAATSSVFAQLNQVVEEKAIVAERGDRVGDLVMEALRPMLKDWLDANLKGIVERAVAKEVKRISSGK